MAVNVRDGDQLASASHHLRDVAHHFDITELRETSEALRRSEEELAATLGSIGDAVIATDTTGCVTRMNRVAEQLTGWAIGEAKGRPLDAVFCVEAAASERPLVLRSRDEIGRPIAANRAPIVDAAGTVRGSVLVFRDLSEEQKAEVAMAESQQALRRMEEQLRQSQKMEAIGRLAGGVAHDFNNMLSVILSYGELLLTELPPSDPSRDDITEMTNAGKRAADLTRQLLMFSRQQVLAPTVVDLNELIAHMHKMLVRLVGEDVTLTANIASVLGRIVVDQSSIEQVILNLVVNARDAMPTGGALAITAADVVLDDAYARAHLGVTPGPYVMLAVSDSGIGMNEATRTRMFEPFFTTKAKDKGTGLGLSTVFGIVQQSAGSIAVSSEEGKGTTISIYFPRVAPSTEVARSPTTRATLRGAETILLVEDEEQVRVVASSILRRSGYRVLEAQHAAEAFRLCEQHPASVHLLVSDVVMPQMSGPALATQLAKAQPGMKILFMSGYTDDSIVRHGILEGQIAFLHKPLTPDTLLRKVRDVLDTPAAE